MAKIIQGNFSAKQRETDKAVKKKTPVAAYQLKVSLLYSEPLIWRRVQVPGDLTLAKLHDVIQLCMGWTDTHLHQFMIGRNLYGPADLDDEWSEIKALDEKKFRLCDLEADMRKRCMYEYDFGDGWQHEIEIEKVITSAEKPSQYPVLLAGARACPPEDVGGVPGYENFLEAMNDPQSEDHAEMMRWYGSDTFDPDFFEMDAINKILKKIK
ncbi:MAG: plasmid pRiA4b ORF-3 family protein [Proteobacteria bacterium]|nr:plasmid pRiA4b ORF-3 family protein [Pseudomonadota bacterium]